RAQTWRQVRNLPVAGGIPADIAVDPNDSSHLYLAMNGPAGGSSTYLGKVLTSYDRGESWTTLPFPNVSIFDLDTDDTGQILSAMTNRDILVSRDSGDNWERISGPWDY